MFCSALELGNKTDHLALLKFKESITNDPYGIFKSWNSSTHFCKWHGITCMQQQRVIELNLSGCHLNGGSISPQLGNLSFLRSINLENNSFHGDIPPELGCLSSLRILHLNNNSLSGEIPVKLTSCSKLIGLDLSWNNLVGKIPSEIGSLWNLKQFSFENNSLTGQIPPSIGNLSSLTDLWLSYNHLEGNIPKEIGRLNNLKNLCLSVSNFSGQLPPFLYNMSSLNQIDVLNNHFNGSLPPNMFHHLPNLKAFIAGKNHFSGTIPTSVTNGSFLLQVLEIGQNNFVGQVPSLGKLKILSKLSLFNNSLGSNSTKDLEFLKSLTNCSNLIGLSISSNNFGGKLPTYLGNLSTQLIELYIANNQIYGNIPNEIGNLVNLTILAMQHNHFGGTFPSTFGKFQNMVDFCIYHHVTNMGSIICLLQLCTEEPGSDSPTLDKVSYRKLHHGTDGFSVRNMIGSGKFGTVYKGILESDDDTPVAIKILVKRGMPHIYKQSRGPIFSRCGTCNTPPSRLARLLSTIGASQLESSTIGMKGTIGYAPPEYGMGSKVSIDGDMYSFGILVLEMLTGKRPTDEMFKDGCDLRNHVEMSLPHNILNIVDPNTYLLYEAYNSEFKDYKHTNLKLKSLTNL
ncbi:hypothetical protein PIB30_040061 [Stylosanthes scabra]|uniref:Protein kinase domain-containing protein n=1 Tax=Stylosanthes scabra TaxID=79078 RepID=A0ABU6VFL1_9FABA|nr:hypothetical protein [Stylosanthes scabra]